MGLTGERVIIPEALGIDATIDCVQEKEKVIAELSNIDPDSPSLGKIISTYRDRFKRFGYCGKAENDRLKAEFNAAVDSVFARRDNIWKENLQIYEDIVCKAEEVSKSEDYKDAKLQMKELREQWNKASHTFKEDEDRLWSRFKQAEDNLYDRARLDYEDRLNKQEDGKLIKTELVRQAEEISFSTDLKTAKDQMKALQEQWKKSPRAPKEEEDALWAKFRQAADMLFEKVNKEYEERKKKQEEAKAIKEDIVQQAEKLAESNDLKAAKDLMKALQEQWKQAPRASREDDDALWLRFRQAADTLFEKCKKEFENRQVNQQRAKNQKEKIISRIESLAILANTSSAAEEVKRLSDEFYNAGSAGKEYNEILKAQLNEAKNHFYSIRRQSSDQKYRSERQSGFVRSEAEQAATEQAEGTETKRDF